MINIDHVQLAAHQVKNVESRRSNSHGVENKRRTTYQF